MRVADLNLQKSLEICRAAELSKERIKTLETPSASGLEVHAVKHKTRHTPQQNRQPQQKPKSSYHANSQSTSTCKYCGRKHEYSKTKCPAFGKECRKCGKPNHFESMCKSGYKTRPRQQRIRALSDESDDENNDYFEIHTVTLTNINSVKSRHSRHIFATMNIIGKNKKSPE